MAQTMDALLESDQDLLLTPVLPASTTALDIAPIALDPAPIALDIAPFGFVPAPAVPDRPALADRPAPRVLPRRRAHLGWYESAVVLLIVSSAALCMYRLCWAIQP